MQASLPHQPVLYQEIIHALQPRSEGYYIDCTLGAGGHAWGILEASEPNGLLLGMDVDPQAIAIARQHLASFGERVIIQQASYTTLIDQLIERGWHSVDGVLLDLGVSTMQLKTPQRGFSFLEDAPLDMRFDPRNPRSAADIVNTLAERELADLLFEFGEEKRSRRIAASICKSRPIQTTRELGDLVARVVGRGQQGIHPATRTFQALRIAVNEELTSLKEVLPQAVESLRSGGRLAVISYHSLEDRIVKHFYRTESRDCICPPRQPVCVCGHKASIREVNRRPIRPNDVEIVTNPRARSARLRVAERLTIP